MMETNRWWKLLVLALPLAVTGCGPELVGGAQREGEVRTVATSDEGAGSALAPDDLAPSPSMAGAGAAQIEGELSMSAAVWLIREDGVAIPLSNGQVPATFRVEGTDEAQLGREDVEARTYTAVRVEFTRVSVIVEGGLLVGGLPIIGPVSVNLGSTNRMVVERPLTLTVEAETTQTVVVDLNAHLWLPEVSLPSLTVGADDFRTAVEVRVR